MPSERGEAEPGRRERNAARRDRRYKGSKSHHTRLCPDCRAHIPYVQDLTDPPAVCPDCGHRFECPECGTDLDAADDPAVCPVCDEPLADEAPDPEESFTWDG